MLYLTYGRFPAQGSSELTDILGREEYEKYTHLTVPKRREEFLGSRLAVKHLISRCCPELKGFTYPRIQVRNEPSGEPYIEVAGIGRLPGRISLSHSHGHILSGYSPQAMRFGLDLEWIEDRPPEFGGDFFTRAEGDLVENARSDDRMLLTTLIWSAKEAVLKAALTGLRVDTRSIEVSSIPDVSPSSAWHRLEIQTTKLEIPSPLVFWYRDRNFVLTLCRLDYPEMVPAWVALDQATVSCGTNTCSSGNNLSP